jgi:hypothetical protein
MRKPITKWVIVAVLISLVGYSGYATYNWLDRQRIDNGILNGAIDLSDFPLAELGSVGLVGEYSVEHDTTGELLNERLYLYFSHARTLAHCSAVLHALTNDEKYQLLGTAMMNLGYFFVDVANGRLDDMEGTLTDNLDTIKQMGNILDGVLQIDRLTLTNAEQLLQLSDNLTGS